MNKTLVAFAALAIASPAEARCFTRWYFPWPQHCAVAIVDIRPAPARSSSGPPLRDTSMIAPADLEKLRKAMMENPRGNEK